MNPLGLVLVAGSGAADMIVASGADRARALGAPVEVVARVRDHLVELAQWGQSEGRDAQILLAPVRASWGSWVDVIAYARSESPWLALSAGATVGEQHRFLSPASVGSEREGVNVRVARFTTEAEAEPPRTDVAGFVLAYPGQEVSGDELVLQSIGGFVRAASIDALGHGELAARSAASLAAFLRTHTDLDAAEVLVAAHRQRAADPRGAAAAVFDVRDDGAATFCGVGNIDVLALGGAARPISRTGTVGVALRSVARESVVLAPGASLVMASDGLALRWSPLAVDTLATLSAPMLMGAALALGERRRDDASMVVVRRPS